MSATLKKKPVIFTIGHSTLPVERFEEILLAHGIRRVADVRTIPRSRHNPQFNSENLAESLGRCGIAYEHMPGLGGLRHARKDSVNTAWENASFRGFADYMQTDEFRTSVDLLVRTSEALPTAIMCAEVVPWRCHRSLIADALLTRGITVMDIMNAKSAKEHALTPWAEVDGENVTYPGKTTEKSTDEQVDRTRIKSEKAG